MMKITKKLRKSKGFTLVELLIVIIIIGILAGMMMLATGAATDKAEATKIVSNMRNVKAAAIMYYADKGVWPESASDDAAVSQYLDQKDLLGGSYTIEPGASADHFVVFTYPANFSAGIGNKLAEMDAVSADEGATGTATMQIN